MLAPRGHEAEPTRCAAHGLLESNVPVHAAPDERPHSWTTPRPPAVTTAPATPRPCRRIGARGAISAHSRQPRARSSPWPRCCSRASSAAWIALRNAQRDVSLEVGKRLADAESRAGAGAARDSELAQRAARDAGQARAARGAPVRIADAAGVARGALPRARAVARRGRAERGRAGAAAGKPAARHRQQRAGGARRAAARRGQARRASTGRSSLRCGARSPATSTA